MAAITPSMATGEAGPDVILVMICCRATWPSWPAEARFSRPG